MKAPRAPRISAMHARARGAAPPAPANPAAAPTQYWLLASAADLARLLRHDVSAALRAQAVALLKRDRYETAEMYLARLGDLVDDVAAAVSEAAE
jgi:hypothetical protein